jgi:hypothetical protein
LIYWLVVLLGFVASGALSTAGTQVGQGFVGEGRRICEDGQVCYIDIARTRIQAKEWRILSMPWGEVVGETGREGLVAARISDTVTGDCKSTSVGSVGSDLSVVEISSASVARVSASDVACD